MTETGVEANSPCNSACRLNPATRVCLGCHRTLDEIAGWARSTEQQRLEILRLARARRDATVE